ncbi:MAG TPA: 1-deoxy-D-xylulose-5-phosphate synthase [Holophagaceae bacterium]|nr:1-deoxy-D-xylulose-5-phosphate synthase [Holophagaceae bacterium]
MTTKYPLLDALGTPEAVRQFTDDQLRDLSAEVRRFIIDSVSETGGHFASNLGTVEMTVALFHQFDFRQDRVVWDVGHQAYPHKILTGRKDRFPTLRQHHGLSGFLKIEESPVYDHFGAGHASTSISAALGMAAARDLQKDDFTCVAVIGDGSMTAGMAFEALNQAGYLETKNFLVILNDNDMSINPNVGSLQGYLNQIMNGQYYNRWRDRIEHAIKAIPLESVSKGVAKAAKWTEESMKRLMVPGLLFEDLGFRYMGPVDGNDAVATSRAIQEAKEVMKDGPVLLHVQTKKGFGYEPAVQDPLKWHGVTAFDAEAGVMKKGATPTAPAYTKVFADALIELAKKDEKIVAITAAMLDGTGLNHFQKAFPARTFDVGIAEQHAVTFAAGMATKGMRPVCAIYSTFLQRGFDQVAHDVCLQDLPVVFAMDRAGIVGADGPTHHGLYDMSFLRSLPHIVLMAPKDENELRRMLMTALYCGHPAALRYPRGNGVGVTLDDTITPLPVGKGELLREGADLALVAYGSQVQTALEAAEVLAKEGIACAVFNARFLKPLDSEQILALARSCKGVVALEEGIEKGGFTSAVAEAMADGAVVKPLLRIAVADHIVHHGDQKRLLDEEGLSTARLVERIRAFQNGL